MKKILFIILAVFNAVVFAQNEPTLVRYKTSVISGLGTNFYRGDVCSSCANVGFQANISSRIHMNNRFFFRPEFAVQHIQSGLDKTSGLQFKNNLTSVNFNFEYALTYDKTKQDKRANNEVFIDFGPSFTHHNPYALIDGEKTFLSPLKTENESYSKLILGLKAGLFSSFKINKDARFGIGIDYTLLLSDYIDDVSGKYIDYSKLDKTRTLAIDPTQKAEIGASRGNSSKFDSLLRVTLSYEFSFEKKVEVF